MDLKVPITIFDELAESVVESKGTLDLASGEIRSVEYQNYDLDTQGLPADDESYEFTMGMLSNGDRDVEFRVDVDVLRTPAAERVALHERTRAGVLQVLHNM